MTQYYIINGTKTINLLRKIYLLIKDERYATLKATVQGIRNVSPYKVTYSTQ